MPIVFDSDIIHNNTLNCYLKSCVQLWLTVKLIMITMNDLVLVKQHYYWTIKIISLLHLPSSGVNGIAWAKFRIRWSKNYEKEKNWQAFIPMVLKVTPFWHMHYCFGINSEDVVLQDPPLYKYWWLVSTLSIFSIKSCMLRKLEQLALIIKKAHVNYEEIVDSLRKAPANNIKALISQQLLINGQA